MKAREDFVTNSSSSSFILAFESKEDGIAKIAAMTKRYGSDYVEQLLHDFMEATPILKENIRLRKGSRRKEAAVKFSREGSYAL